MANLRNDMINQIAKCYFFKTDMDNGSVIFYKYLIRGLLQTHYDSLKF